MFHLAGKTAIVQIVDSCPTCHSKFDLDLSTDAWNMVSGSEDPSRYQGSWKYVPCPETVISGRTKLRLKGAVIIFF
jgi:hypothetical protein